MPSSVVEARYNLNILSCRSSYNLNMLITVISMKAKCDKRTMKKENETAKITAQLTWKVRVYPPGGGRKGLRYWVIFGAVLR